MTQSSVYDLEIKKKVVRFIRMLLTGVVVFGFSNVHLLSQENLKRCYQKNICPYKSQALENWTRHFFCTLPTFSERHQAI